MKTSSSYNFAVFNHSKKNSRNSCCLDKDSVKTQDSKSSFKYGLKHEFDLVKKNDDSNGYKEEANRAPAPTESNDVRIEYMSKLQFGLSK